LLYLSTFLLPVRGGVAGRFIDLSGDTGAGLLLGNIAVVAVGAGAWKRSNSKGVDCEYIKGEVVCSDCADEVRVGEKRSVA
jgi:hypothetical protein